MTNEQIKTALISLRPVDHDFTVTQTGKASRKVNGLYMRDTFEIIIHNKNFKNDNELMFTAIHEYTHHIRNISGDITERRAAHGGAFWTTFYKLIEEAEKQGIYCTFCNVTEENKTEITGLIDDIKEIDADISARYIQMGGSLRQLHEKCNNNNLRYDDIIDRYLHLKRSTEKIAVRASVEGENTPAGHDLQRIYLSTAKRNVRENIGAFSGQNVSIAQMKSGNVVPLPQLSRQQQIKRDIEKTDRAIERLSALKASLVQELEEIEGE